jgi:hypothetical protein
MNELLLLGLIVVGRVARALVIVAFIIGAVIQAA